MTRSKDLQQPSTSPVMYRYRVLLALAPLLAAPAAAQDRIITLAGRRVAVWEAQGTRNGPAPVLFFSHGFGACETSSNFLKTTLAARGYWVFAPRHADAGCGARRATTPAVPAVPFGLPGEWSDATYVDRANDLLAIHGALQASPTYAKRLDFSRVGYVGHSLGGYTVVGLAGGWRAWGTPPGLRAVLALSPYIEPFVEHRTMGNLSVPIMFQGGTADNGVTPFVTRRGGAYDSAPAPKYLVVFSGATHEAWGDRRKGSHADIVAYSIAFLDRYVRDRAPTATLTTVRSGVAALRFEADTVAR
jgi:predicted dienelactone hydrolase